MSDKKKDKAREIIETIFRDCGIPSNEIEEASVYYLKSEIEKQVKDARVNIIDKLGIKAEMIALKLDTADETVVDEYDLAQWSGQLAILTELRKELKE